MKEIIKWFLDNGAVKQAFWIAVAAGAATIIMMLTQGCTSTHNVVQSSQSTMYKRNDTTVTEVKITYEQVGRVQK